MKVALNKDIYMANERALLKGRELYPKSVNGKTTWWPCPGNYNFGLEDMSEEWAVENLETVNFNRNFNKYINERN